MRAWSVDDDTHRLLLGEKPAPEPGPAEIVVKVQACGVCRTDLHVIDADLPMHIAHVTPGHQVVGTVVEQGADARLHPIGTRVGVAWLGGTCGVCEWCTSGRENLCPESTYTGWDSDGGYAEYVSVRQSFAYPLPDDDAPEAIAPLLCAGIIGFRALSRAQLPPGGRLGIYGYGSSGHITAQLAKAAGAEIVVMTRGEGNQALARRLGAAFVGGERDQPPSPVDSAIIFAPAGDLVPVALAATKRGGTVVSAGIHMSELPPIDYDALLFGERDLRSVQANTRQDGRQFLQVAHNLGLRPTVTTYPFEHADRAVDDLRSGRLSGSAVLTM
ncbi:MAG: zinc-binding alcohol dehydrogenase family protein [Subtercola sp.]|nr:zinc-binding alcohol dehydrogenase family protein [Subtercola sp.]